MENEKPEKNKSESEEEREEGKQDDEESVSCARINLIFVFLPTGLSRINNYRQVLDWLSS